jgi:preprotein translocase subunit SecB
MSEENQKAQQEQPQGQIALQQVYTKDISFESPNAPQIFSEMSQGESKMQHQFSINSKVVGENFYEVELGVTVTVTSKEKTAFLVEVKQAGIFNITNFSENQLGYLVNTFCPNTLFPYVREIISSLVTRGSFMPLFLQPVNFEAMYAQKVEEMQKQQAEQNAKQGTEA